jgi:hypothetical protein
MISNNAQSSSNNHRFRLATNRMLKEKNERHTKMYRDGSEREEEVGYAVIWEEQTIIWQIHPHNSIYSAEQSAIINATWKRRTEGDIHGWMMAVSNRKRTKNPKTLSIRKLMDQQGGKITLLWVQGHVGVTGNENADTAAKKALNE